jgi:hypothetical protein
MIRLKPTLAPRVDTLPGPMQDAVRLICHSRTHEANTTGKAAHGALWADIDPCVNSGEVCQGCIDRAKEAGTGII